ncbi:MAG: protoporphyrinogen oxidase [Firmicutes bacterium]|nr:protoporphyrinogen oxidase [Bacillota bacterium]
MKRIAIIGGGITGLSAAYTIKRANDDGNKIDYVLLERDSRLGGKICTERTKDGFVIEGGPDSFLSTKPWLFELARKLNCEDMIIPSNDELKKTYILVKNKLRTLPDGVMMVVPTKIMPFVTTDLFSWLGKIRMAMDYFIPKKKEPGDETLSSFITRRLGKECLDRLADPLVAGVYSSDPDLMSLQATFPVLLDMEQKYGSLIKGTIASMKARQKVVAQDVGRGEPPAGGKPGAPGVLKRTLHMSFKGGMQDIVDRLYAAIDKDKVFIGSNVLKVDEVKDERGATIYKLQMADGKTIEADALILASPANDTAGLVSDIDKELASVLREIPYVSSATVSLAYRRKDVKHDFKGFGFLVPLGEGRKIKACTWSSSKWSGRVPSDDFAIVRVFLGGARTQELALLPDNKMLAVAKSEVKNIMGIEAEPINNWVFRWPNAMPQYTIGHLDRIKKIEERASNHPGLFLAGGSYRGVGIPDCINSGTKAAEEAITYLAESLEPAKV